MGIRLADGGEAGRVPCPHPSVQPTRRCGLVPLKRVRDTIERVYGLDEIPISLRDEEGLVRVKADLIDRALRDRCDFVSTSI